MKCELPTHSRTMISSARRRKRQRKYCPTTKKNFSSYLMQTSSKILLAFDEFKRQVIDLSARDLPFLRRHCGVDHGTIAIF